VIQAGDRELRAVRDFVRAASCTDGSEPFPEPVLESLGRVIPGAIVGYTSHRNADK
jgi:hypothetical protein